MIRRLTAETVATAKRLTRECGLTQKQAADILGVERSTISFAIHGKSKTAYPSSNDRHSIAAFLRKVADEMDQLPDNSRQFAFMREMK